MVLTHWLSKRCPSLHSRFIDGSESRDIAQVQGAGKHNPVACWGREPEIQPGG